jgi:hypothetical protein
LITAAGNFHIAVAGGDYKANVANIHAQELQLEQEKLSQIEDHARTLESENRERFKSIIQDIVGHAQRQMEMNNRTTGG